MNSRWMTRLAVVIGIGVLVPLTACGTRPAPTNPVNNPNASRVSVAMVTHGQAKDPFWAQLQRGARQAADDFNVELSYDAPASTDPQAQADSIRVAADRRPAAMVVTVPDPVVVEPIRQASRSGIPVVVANVGAAELDQVGALTYVGQDDLAAGQQAGTEMAQAGKRHALCVIHEQRNRALADRCAGFADKLTAAGGTASVLQVNGADQAGAEAAVADALRRDPAIDGVLTTGILGFGPASAAIKELGAAGRITVGTFDVSVETPNDLDGVRSGEVLFVVDQQPFLQGYEAVQVAAFQARFGQHPFRPIHTGPSLVTKSNVDRVDELYRNLDAARAKRVTVAMVTHGQGFDPFWALVRKGAEQAAADFNVALQYSSPGREDPNEQAQLVTDAVNGKPDALVATIPSAALVAPAKHAVDTGVPVLLLNIGSSQQDAVGAFGYVGQDETLAGQEAGAAMAQAGARHALCVIHEQNNQALIDRCNGFRAQLAVSGGTVTTVSVSGTDLAQAQQVVATALGRDSSIDGVLTTGVAGFTATSGALRQVGALGRVKLGAFDVSTGNLTAVEEGQAQFVVDQQPFLQGYDAVQLAAIEARFGQHPYGPVFTGPSLITRNNAAQVRELYQSKTVALVQQGGYPN